MYYFSDKFHTHFYELFLFQNQYKCKDKKKKAILVTVLALCKANIFLYRFSVSHYRVR